MSPGQTGHITGQMGRVPGTDGTHTRECPTKILYVYCFFSFPCRHPLGPSLPPPLSRENHPPFLGFSIRNRAPLLLAPRTPPSPPPSRKNKSEPSTKIRNSQSREAKSVHYHHRKKISWRTFLASKMNFSGRWSIHKPHIPTKKTVSSTEIFRLWPPFFSAKKSSPLELGGHEQ